ncbi:MAG: ATP-binding cassette domain-containing protein [Opitutales bacterium]|nr:ATP-binding cassette domain-containing protein [Opitutales bacterium]MCH8539388.1 ATP-binding cassette domain-containing protein [Opitutales bacterium]
MISIEKLTKSYQLKNRRHYVFRDLNLHFPEGTNIGIIGPNGAGKSTFLRLLGGIDYPDCGRIRTDKSFSWPLGLQGGFVRHMTGRGNCRMICNLYGLGREVMREKLEVVKSLSGIGHYFEEPVQTYSSGMSGRLGFALSMAFDFDYFLIDEITSVGDAHFKKLAKEALETKARSSKVIMVSHSMADLKKFCDLGVLIKDGKLTVYKDLDEAISHYLPGKPQISTVATSGPERDLQGLFLDDVEISQGMDSLWQEIEGLLHSINQKLALPNFRIEQNIAGFFAQLGTVYFQLNDWQKAIHFHHRALSDNPDFIPSLQQLVVLYGHLGRKIDKKVTLEKLGRLAPENPRFLVEKTKKCLAAENREEALRLLEILLDSHPEHPEAQSLKARILFEQEHVEAALHLQANLLKTHPETPAYYLQLGRFLAALGRYEEALKAEWKAASIGSSFPEKKYQSIGHTLGNLDRSLTF